MVAGVAGYFIYSAIGFPPEVTTVVVEIIGYVQPLLIFTMLFLTFCRLDLTDLKFRKWHIWLLLIQTGIFSLISLLLIEMPRTGWRVILEGTMLCLICPTATAGAVITRKLGGDVAGITTYTIFINLATAILIPTFVPFVHPQPGNDMLTAGLLILSKVFPLLLFPLLAALLIKRFLPVFALKLAEWQELSFYLWGVALALALTVTTRSIVHSDVSWYTQLGLVGVSLLCCILQFYLGRKIGRRYGDAVTGGQSLGQKNTVLVIWMGYTFFSPVTAVVGGFYSIWHNVINSWQLYRHEHKKHNK
ncbi:MAG: transporter [Muribaculaceae bacterium]|nr:transporter [Muribaculaceae bacterium]